MGRNGTPWTADERSLLKRAGRVYELQWAMVFACEPTFKARGINAVRNTGKKLMGDDTVAEASGGLRIDTDPEAVARDASAFAANRPRTWIPAALADHAAKVEDAPEVERPDPTDREVLRLERKVADMDRQLREARKKLKAVHRDEALFEALANVAAEHITPLPPTKPLPRQKARDATPVDGVLLLSDEHADQVIQAPTVWGLEDYDFNIFRCRFHRLIQTTTEYLTEHLPRHNFERLWVFSLGDKLHGDIHNAGPHNHFPNALKAAIAVAEVEAHGIQELARHVPVHWVGVSGNHPRRSVRKDYRGPTDNFDFMVSAMVAMLLKNDIEAGRVSVDAPDSWTAFCDVRGHLWCLNHGDDVTGYAGFPWYGFSRRNNRVQALTARKKQRVRYFAYGHFHTAVEMQEADAESLHAGNWSLTDDYAIGKLAVGSEPVQQLYAVDDKRGIVLKVPIYVRDDDAEESFRAGDWEPAFGRSLVTEHIEGRDRVAELPVVRAA